MKISVTSRIFALTAVAGLVGSTGGSSTAAASPDHSLAASLPTTTPIKHLVVLFQENASFDHYFGAYPHAANPSGEPVFTARGNIPAVNGLTPDLLTHNPNSGQPFRLDRSQALTCSQVHNYLPEQQAENGGAMDKFVQYTQGKQGSDKRQYCPNGSNGTPSIVMGYYDGNTVTALWNYAQHFAMNDNAFNTVFGPSTPGALSLVAGTTAGVICGPTSAVYNTPGACSTSTMPATSGGTGTAYRDSDPYYDDCSTGGTKDKSNTTAITRTTIATPLNSADITWGWFQGGFANCSAKHPLAAYDRMLGADPAADTVTFNDYDPHHEPFQYFQATANPHHLPPSSTAMIGQMDQANHQYDLTDFWTAADAGNLPAVSFLKAPGYQDGHPASSDPLDEQEYLVNTINHLMSLPSWKSTAIIIGWDDSDGWYDHVRGSIVNRSNTPLDFGCGTTTDGLGAQCGYGPRLPYLVISPYARDNYVDHTLIDETSTTRFIEDNWLGGTRLSSFNARAGSIQGMFDFTRPSDWQLFLDPQTGSVTLTPTTGTPGSICGTVSGFTPATTSAAGTITIGTTTYTLTAGTTLMGGSTTTNGSSACLAGTLNAAGQLTGGTLTPNVSSTPQICGVVSAYTAATATAGGTLVAAGITFPLAVGATVTGTPPVTVGTALAGTLTLNGLGQVTTIAVTGSSCPRQSISGPITSSTAPTTTTLGSITVAGVTYPIAAGTSISINGRTPLAAVLWIGSSQGVRTLGLIAE